MADNIAKITTKKVTDSLFINIGQFINITITTQVEKSMITPNFIQCFPVFYRWESMIIGQYQIYIMEIFYF